MQLTLVLIWQFGTVLSVDLLFWIEKSTVENQSFMFWQFFEEKNPVATLMLLTKLATLMLHILFQYNEHDVCDIQIR